MALMYSLFTLAMNAPLQPLCVPLQWPLVNAVTMAALPCLVAVCCLSHFVLFRDVMVVLVLLTFFRANASGETRYILHLILMSKVRLENKFCEKLGALPHTVC